MPIEPVRQFIPDVAQAKKTGNLRAWKSKNLNATPDDPMACGSQVAAAGLAAVLGREIRHELGRMNLSFGLGNCLDS